MSPSVFVIVPSFSGWLSNAETVDLCGKRAVAVLLSPVFRANKGVTDFL
ncbi:hypothetical protein CLOSTHATH_01575 [Hungatella hathewayi DSM 13479]|uniref:Uncharacterized protein n=2 Tax=Hungatella hathewayi TaxID=154046 RepID=D3AD97_9FIRM|nr:hypothetical protein CLOSTHATH_01575 [Hungatella hathewayi DSM 13479]